MSIVYYLTVLRMIIPRRWSMKSRLYYKHSSLSLALWRERIVNCNLNSKRPYIKVVRFWGRNYRNSGVHNFLQFLLVDFDFTQHFVFVTSYRKVGKGHLTILDSKAQRQADRRLCENVLLDQFWGNSPTPLHYTCRFCMFRGGHMTRKIILSY